MEHLGRLIILFGVVLVVIGLVITFFDRIPLIGKLPGDIHIKRDNFQFYFPLATSIVISLVLTAILWLVNALRR
jgi:hypothetical protein